MHVGSAPCVSLMPSHGAELPLQVLQWAEDSVTANSKLGAREQEAQPFKWEDRTVCATENDSGCATRLPRAPMLALGLGGLEKSTLPLGGSVSSS